jgi:hypothetical protein
MIVWHDLSEINERELILQHLADEKYDTVIDIGAAYQPWAKKYTNFALDVNPVDVPNWFRGNICTVDGWREVLDYVEKNDKFQFAICTHTLEDISNPYFVCDMLSLIADAGYIATPSKYVELTKTVRPWRGWMHHRWIFDVQDNEYWAAPKLSFVDHLTLPDWTNSPQEIQLLWKDEIKLHILNDDFIGPSEEAYTEMFMEFALK